MNVGFSLAGRLARLGLGLARLAVKDYLAGLGVKGHLAGLGVKDKLAGLAKLTFFITCIAFLGSFDATT